jgi:hypothetical protein
MRAAALLWLATLAACSHGSSGPATVGVGIGVALTSPSGTTLVAQGGTIQIDATVSGDPSNAGVNWILAGAGSIASSTTTQVIYQAPSGVVGATFATVTALSVTDPTKYSSVTLTVNGTPKIVPPVLFPANQNVAYTTYINAAGGTAPYAWSISAGALPAGLALGTSTASTTAISGTPSALGPSTFTLLLKDAAGLTDSISLTITVAPQTACLLSGPYAYLQTGFYKGQAVTRAGSISVSSTGQITGVHDYKDATNVHPAAAISSGTCQTVTQNRGQLHISATATGNETFDFAAVTSLKSGHLQQDDGSQVVEAGEFFQQDAAAFNLPALAGDWVFGVAGDDGAARRLAIIGRLTLDAGGVISAGVADSNAATPVSGGAVTGTLTAADANGRGTATLSVGGQSLPIAYYVVDQNTIFVVTSDSPASTPRIAGRMTRQAGFGTLDATTLSGPAILSLWGTSAVAGAPSATVGLGRLSGAAAAAGSAKGTVNVEFDIADRGAQSVNATFTAQPYAVAPNGRGTLAVGSGTSVQNFVLYANGVGGGYVLEPASQFGLFGILDAQRAGPYDDFSTGYYVGGTMYPGSTSPITLAPQLLFQSGAIAGNLTGNYAIDPTTGRMVAAVSRTILGGSDLVIYIVTNQKIAIMGDGLNISNSQLAWFDVY